MTGEIHPLKKVTVEKVGVKVGERVEVRGMGESSPIGVFDSGVGGLTIMTEMLRQLKDENVIYLADTARVPYGGRPPQEIIKINHEILDYFVEQGAKMVIMACGTSSSIAYPVVKDKYKIPIISLIGPGSRAAVEATRNGKIGLLATIGTVESGAYQRAIKELKPEAEVVAEACPLFVPLIEGGFIEAEETRRVAREYLKPLLNAGVDTIILGCTHYPHLLKILKEIAGSEVTFIDPAEGAVGEAKGILNKAGLLNRAGPAGKYEYVVTGSPIQFQDLGSRLLGKPIGAAKLVKLGGS